LLPSWGSTFGVFTLTFPALAIPPWIPMIWSNRWICNHRFPFSMFS
jgi:hypothetical protein